MNHYQCRDTDDYRSLMTVVQILATESIEFVIFSILLSQRVSIQHGAN